MKRIFGWLGSLLMALCIGTTISLLVLTAMLWWKGALADDRLLGMIAALQGIRPLPPDAAEGADPAAAEQPSLDQIMQTRLRASLDLDLRVFKNIQMFVHAEERDLRSAIDGARRGRCELLD